MRDPYTVLGVARNAPEAEIKSAYRRLAKSLHPDLRPGEAEAEARFQELQGAYRILKDPQMRLRYNRGFIDAYGNPQNSLFEEALREAARREAARTHGRAKVRATAGGEPNGKGEREDVLSEFMTNIRRGRQGIVEDKIPVTVSFSEAVRGVRRTVELPSGHLVAVTIPPGTETGQILRLRNINPKTPRVGTDGAQAMPEMGSALEVEVTVIPDPRFVRDGLDLVCAVPITLPEAVLGAQIRIPIPGGTVKVIVPAGSNSGTILKLRGQGIRRPDGLAGNLRLELKVVLPAKIDPDFEAQIRSWAEAHPYEVRS